MTNDFYSYDAIDATGCTYRIVIGERSNGKSYGFKKDKALKASILNDRQFAYIRRYAEEIKIKRVNNYMADMADVIHEYASERYPEYTHFDVSARQGEFVLYGWTDESEPKAIKTLGFYFALAQSAYDKSASYPNVYNIVYEEFLAPTGTRELHDESMLFFNLISTIVRRRVGVVIYLLGNTVSRNGQILQHMGINVRDMAKGEIKAFRYESENARGETITTTVAVERCREYEKSTDAEAYFAFGSAREMMIRNGEWDVIEYPKITPDELRRVKYYGRTGIVFRDVQICLYAYFANDGKMFVYSARQPIDCEYITVTKDSTIYNRRQFAWSGDDKCVERLRKVVTSALSRGMVRYENDLIGDDFTYLLQILKRGV